MFGMFREKKSLVRQRVQALAWVRRTWFEWCVEEGQTRRTLVVEVGFMTDPQAVDFRNEVLEDIRKTVQATDVEEPMPGLRVRIIPRMYDRATSPG